MTKWIRINPLQEDDGGAYICSDCRRGNWDIDGTESECPFCGAKMVESQESEEGNEKI